MQTSESPTSLFCGIVAFFGIGGYAIATYGWFLGLGLGWIPALCIAILIRATLQYTLPSLIILLWSFLPYYIAPLLLFVFYPLIRDGELSEAGRMWGLGIPLVIAGVLLYLVVKRQFLTWWQSGEPKI